MHVKQMHTTGSVRSTVAIVGGGAAGVSLFAQYVDRAIDQAKVNISIVVYEGSGDIGPGLAYSTDLPCNILNMRSSMMSILPDEPHHFLDWLRKNSSHLEALYPDMDMSYPPRATYGQYLREVFEEKSAMARSAGIDVRIVPIFVSDVQELQNEAVLILCNGEVHKAATIFLALGNFPPSLYKEFRGLGGYISSPWPDTTLIASIPKDEPVCIIGSRLSAIDTAVSLVHAGHTGSITFVSRSGRLPKVQNTVPMDFPTVTLDDLDCSLKNNQDDALKRIVQTLSQGISSIQGISPDLKKLLKVPDDPLETLRSDISDALTGKSQWQSVLSATASYVECYWNACSDEERNEFCTLYKSLWLSYRHSIPVVNAQKILQLLQSGQLSVVKGRKAMRYDYTTKIFILDAEGQSVHSKYVVNATGDEYDVCSIQSELLQNLLRSGVLIPHKFGGVHVDFQTLATVNSDGVVSNRIYTLGSLTHGTHLYTNAIDRNVAYAKRICDKVIPVRVKSSIHVKPKKQLTVSLFMGSDIMSHFMLNRLVPKLLYEGYKPCIIIPSDSINVKSRPFPLQELAFFERQLLHENIAPFLDQYKVQSGVPCLTRSQIESHLGVDVHYVDSINSMSTMNILQRSQVNVGFSIRCYQKFGNRIIQYFDESEDRHLLNLHPGILPMYRGVMTTIRSMNDSETLFGYSLHKIDADYDAGDIISIRTHPIDYRKSMLLFMNDVYPIGVSMILSCIASIAKGDLLRSEPQSLEDSSYYGFPTEEELSGYRRKSLSLVHSQSMIELLVLSFSVPGTLQEYALRHVIEHAVQKQYANSRIHTSPIISQLTPVSL